jgi:metal-responsive CopG/Arc/MetJ family transcriptional regulator
MNVARKWLVKGIAMRQGTVYRIYTEEKNKTAIVQLVAREFESFTLQPTLGYYRNKSEKSIVIEIVGGSANRVKRVAERIRKMNGQKSVLVLTLAAHTEIHRT